MTQEYVVGYMYSPNLSGVLLLEKDRGPAFLHGLLTGPGGKVERGETKEAAMRREFLEETGVDEPFWKHFASLTVGPDEALVHFFRTCSMQIFQAKTPPGGEQLCWPALVNLPSLKLVDDGRWLIPLGACLFSNNATTRIEVNL